MKNEIFILYTNLTIYQASCDPLNHIQIILRSEQLSIKSTSLNVNRNSLDTTDQGQTKTIFQLMNKFAKNFAKTSG